MIHGTWLCREQAPRPAAHVYANAAALLRRQLQAPQHAHCGPSLQHVDHPRVRRRAGTAACAVQHAGDLRTVGLSQMHARVQIAQATDLPLPRRGGVALELDRREEHRVDQRDSVDPVLRPVELRCDLHNAPCGSDRDSPQQSYGVSKLDIEQTQVSGSGSGSGSDSSSGSGHAGRAGLGGVASGSATRPQKPSSSGRAAFTRWITVSYLHCRPCGSEHGSPWRSHWVCGQG